jgi:hypothetical protein
MGCQLGAGLMEAYKNCVSLPNLEASLPTELLLLQNFHILHLAHAVCETRFQRAAVNQFVAVAPKSSKLRKLDTNGFKLPI